MGNLRHHTEGMEMNLDQAERIVSNLQGKGYEATVYEDYSGRCMYGETCVGISGERDMASEIAYEWAQEDYPKKDMPIREDSLGLGSIYY